jgi:hypothetical protein
VRFALTSAGLRRVVCLLRCERQRNGIHLRVDFCFLPIAS